MLLSKKVVRHILLLDGFTKGCCVVFDDVRRVYAQPISSFLSRRRTKNRTIIHKTTFNSVIRIFRNIKKRISLNLSLYFRYRKIHPSPFDFSILIFLPRLLSIVPFSIFPYPLPFGYLFFSKKRKKRIVLF